jgi:hypothetical protein
MRFIFFIWLILINLSSLGQNNGQFAQNDVINVFYLGYENNTYLFKITNKLDCRIEIKYRFEQTPSVDTSVLDSIYISIPYQSLPSVKFTVKPSPQSVCILGGSQIDMGLLEINTSFGVLNISPSNFITNPRNINTTSVQIIGGVLKMDVGNKTVLQTTTIYNERGEMLFRKKYLVDKSINIPINTYFSSGFNLITIRFEDRFNDIFVLKYYKNP